MKYRYLYQTKDNENREGVINAPNRAEAYAALRKQGIRPYRVIGDDPSPWRRRALVASLSLGAVVLASAVTFLVVGGGGPSREPANRAQLTGDVQFIAKCAAESWEGVLATSLDRHLAAYAQPGWKLEPPAPTEEDLKAFERELGEPLAREADERDEVRQLRNILAKMREEMKSYIAEGGTVADYVEFLSERQDRECELREKAMETLARAPESMRRRAWLNLNIRLGDMGIAPLPEQLAPSGSSSAE